MDIARVTEEHKSTYTIRRGENEYTATVRGTFHMSDEFPKVGDFVEYTVTTSGQAVIEKILPRKSQIIRNTSERSRRSTVARPQVIVTNVDILFVVMGLDEDYNLRRLERYLVLAQQSGITPVVILNKADTIENENEILTQVKSVAGETPIHFISARTGRGMDVFKNYFDKDTTAVLLGSSGAGKSTITNWLLNKSIQETGDVREDDSRGRHTTTSRQLFELPEKGFLIDTPGMRELGMLATNEDETPVFLDIVALAEECKFKDCDHEKSVGCAILAALEAGEIDPAHFESYKKIEKEKQFQVAKNDPALQVEVKQKNKQIHKEYNRIQTERRKRKSGDYEE